MRRNTSRVDLLIKNSTFLVSVSSLTHWSVLYFFTSRFFFSFLAAGTLDLLLLLIPGAILISGEHQILIKGHDLLEDSRSDIFSVHGTVNKCWQKPGKAVGEEFDLETSSIATKFSVLCLEPQANLDQDDRSATLGLLAYTGLPCR